MVTISISKIESGEDVDIQTNHFVEIQLILNCLLHEYFI